MLVYSRPGLIELLPALPAAWAANGEITGVAATGGFTVDLQWRQGIATKATIHSIGGTSTSVRFHGRTHKISVKPGRSTTFRGRDDIECLFDGKRRVDGCRRVAVRRVD